MNTANLQLEGLYLSIAALNNALVQKGVLSREEVNHALRIADTQPCAERSSTTRSLDPQSHDA